MLAQDILVCFNYGSNCSYTVNEIAEVLCSHQDIKIADHTAIFLE
ncbi:Uncharacterised protein [Mycobacteroides abscessus subsp. abscessus]|nr:Uncharacterised protein [Mycobacteroides abscessus subsp. abscessus]